MALNLSGFSNSITPQGSEAAQWKEAAGSLGEQLSNKQTAVINAFTEYNNATEADKQGKMALIQKAQFEFENTKQIFELFQTMLKGTGEIIMNLIRRLEIR